MKSLRWAPWLMAGLSPVLAEAQQVTLPLARYDELRELARPKPEPTPEPVAPVAFEEAVLRVRVDAAGTAEEAGARIDQTWSLMVSGEGWRELALPSAGTLISADFGTGEGRLENGTVRVRGVGRHRLSLSSVVALRLDEQATQSIWRLRLQAPRAALVRGELKVPPDIVRVAAEGAVVSSQPTDGRWSLVAEPGAEVTLTLYGTARAPERWSLPLHFAATTAVSVELSRGRRRARAWIDARVHQGELEDLAVEVPNGFEVLKVTGEQLAGWEVDQGRLLLTPLAPIREHWQLEISLAGTPRDELASPILLAEGAASTLAASKLHVVGDGLLQWLAVGDGRRPDERQLAELPPAFLGRPGMALVVPAGGALPRWRLDWPEQVEVLSAQVDRLLVDVLMGSDGRATARLWAEVRSRGTAELSIELPEGSRLVSAHRDGRPVDPGLAGGAWVLPLAARAEPQVVSVSSLLELDFPIAAGELEVPLPLLSAPVAQVEARLLLPAGRRYRLVDAARQGPVAAPPETSVTVRPASAQGGLGLLGGVAASGSRHVRQLFAVPPGVRVVEAAWSTLKPSPAPLVVRVERERRREEWF